MRIVLTCHNHTHIIIYHMLNTLHLRDIHKNRKLKICGIIQAQVQKIFISEPGYILIKIHIFKI